jgi:AcrR family transcriptional regulator
MTAESLRDRQRAQVLTDIRRAAFRLFVQRGYDAVTTEEIATAAGISPRTLFRYVPTKEDLLLGPVRHGGTAIVNLLDARPANESPDHALINAIVARTRSFDESDCTQWRSALLVAPHLLDTVSIHTQAEKDRAITLVAARMGTDPTTDLRPGLLVHLCFAAADFAFQQWVRQTSAGRPLDQYVTEALAAVKNRYWVRSRTPAPRAEPKSTAR